MEQRIHGVRIYGSEYVCTGSHVWGTSHNGIIMCELCHVCREEKDVPRHEWRTREKEALEESIRRHMAELRALDIKIWRGIESVSSRKVLAETLNNEIDALKTWGDLI